MFSKLPQKIPFNLLGDEAKLAFRSQAGGITKLATTRVSKVRRDSSVQLNGALNFRTYQRAIPTGTK